MAEVALESVSKTYADDARAVADVDLRVHDGELVVLVGPSGCGKTTTLRMIAGLEPVSRGTITIGGRDVRDVPPERRDVAMVFQDFALYPHMTARRNLAFALKLRKVPAAEIERRIARVAPLLGLAELLDRTPAALSGGQQQRVAVGRAMVREPACALFDEPLSNLDPALRRRLRAELKALHRRIGTTMIYVTHDQEEAMSLGDRLVVMHAGRVQQIGPPLEIYRRPANRFVAEFVGSPPMSFLRGRLERRGDRTVFTDGAVHVAVDGDVAPRAAAVMGVRPEQLRLEGDGDGGGDDGLVIRADVEVTEPLGAWLDVHGTTAAGDRVTARVPVAADCRPGRPAAFRIDPSEILLFEPGPLGPRLDAGAARRDTELPS